MIDWSRIRTIEDVFKLDEDVLYDESNDTLTNGRLRVRPNLSDEDYEDAKFWAQYSRGLMLITGEPGAGKGITVHMIAKKMSYYFGKLAILDTRPRKIFGSYMPFSEEMLAEQIERMSEMENGVPRPYVVKGLTEIDFMENADDYLEYKKLSPVEQYEELQLKGRVPQDAVLQDYNKRRNEFTATVEFKPYVDADGKWITSRGEMFLRNSVVMMDEFGSKYMSRLSSPTMAIKQILLKLFNFWRHMHCLMIGVGVSLEDFDRKCFPKVVWQAHCTRLSELYAPAESPEDIMVGVTITPRKYNPIRDELAKAGDAVVLVINASEKKEVLGGYSWKDIFNTENAQGFELPRRYRRRQ
jgi:hypothetical protein